MPIYGKIFIALAFLVALEFFVHLIYHWRTGKGGLYDPPFTYLKDIFSVSCRTDNGYLYNKTYERRK